jgi:hypothetical protein
MRQNRACLHVPRCSCRFDHAHLLHEKSCGVVACSSFIVFSREDKRCRPAVYWLSGVRGTWQPDACLRLVHGVRHTRHLWLSAAAPVPAQRLCCRPEASRPHDATVQRRWHYGFFSQARKASLRHKNRRQALSTSMIAFAKASGASSGRLCPMPPAMSRCSYLPTYFLA